jgi:hypothetical protein
MQVTLRGFQWLVDLPDDLRVEPEEELSEGLQALKDMNSLLMARLDAADRELAAKNEQIRELHILLQGLQAALPSPQGIQRPWWRFWQR